MRRASWILGLALSLAAAGVALLWWQQRPGTQWTTASPAALAEFRHGLEAEMKYYRAEAVAHFEKAAQLDPGFVMPKLKQLDYTQHGDKETARRLIAELKAASPEHLSPREEFLLSYRLARTQHENARAEKILTAYLKSYPNDPFALSIRCESAWERRDWKEAEDCNRRLLKVDPNWVQAQNELGYIAMGQGRFAEAEDLFSTYRYIAPDQPNPHDSVGELLTLLGRYPEAEAQLEEAVKIKPDFCASWEHLIELHEIAGEAAKAAATLDRMRQSGGCSRDVLDREVCRVALWESIDRNDWAAAWAAAEEHGCNQRKGAISLFTYRAALLSGRTAEASAMQQGVVEELKLMEGDDPEGRAVIAHMQGIRKELEGKPQEAVQLLRQADQDLFYWSDGEAIFKILNRLDLARNLLLAGDTAGGQAMAQEVRQVNPHFAERFAHIRLGREPSRTASR